MQETLSMIISRGLWRTTMSFEEFVAIPENERMNNQNLRTLVFQTIATMSYSQSQSIAEYSQSPIADLSIPHDPLSLDPLLVQIDAQYHPIVPTEVKKPKKQLIPIRFPILKQMSVATPHIPVLNPTNKLFKNSLKFMLQYIEAENHSYSNDVNSYQSLLLELNPNHSKWSCSEKIGQEELYEAFDKVLSELRNYTEHSSPFLQRVKKTEAPDYFNVIKNPMDLGTMSKKLKAHEYSCKKDFQQDLDLIWTNCFTYNKLPGNIYSTHAEAMRTRALLLMQNVPEISIKNRNDDSSDDDEKDSQIEPTALENLDNTQSLSKSPSAMNSNSDNKGRSLSPSAINKAQSLSMSPNAMKIDENAMKIDEKQQNLENPNSMNENAMNIDEKQQNLENVLFPEDFSKETSVDPQQNDSADVGPSENVKTGFIDDSLETIKWNDLTGEFRQNTLENIIFQIHQPFGERSVIQPSPSYLRAYTIGEAEFLKRTGIMTELVLDKTGKISWPKIDTYLAKTTPIFFEKGLSSNGGFDDTFNKSGSVESLPSKEKDNSEGLITEFFVPELFSYSLPSLHQPLNAFGVNELTPEDLFDSNIFFSLPSISDYDEFSPAKHSGITSMMKMNIYHLRKIKEYFARINAKETKFVEQLLGIPPIPQYYESPKDLIKPPTIPELNENSFDEILTQNISLILAHVGFDATHGSALSTILDISKKFLFNLGKTMSLYKERFSGIMTNEDILYKTLSLNNFEDFQKLDYYLRVEIQQYGVKLNELRLKLSTAYQEFETLPENGDIVLEDHSEQVMSGSLFQEANVDILGLKELGLDIFSVPTSLWNRKAEKKIRGRLKRRFVHDAVEEEHTMEVDEKMEKLKWDAVVPSKQIGLLREFYTKKMQEGDMIEDEDKPKLKTDAAQILLKKAINGRDKDRKLKDELENKLKRKINSQSQKKKDSIAASGSNSGNAESAAAKNSAKELKKLEKQKLKDEKKKKKKSVAPQQIDEIL